MTPPLSRDALLYLAYMTCTTEQITGDVSVVCAWPIRRYAKAKGESWAWLRAALRETEGA